MPNWPISDVASLASLSGLSAASRSRKARVPERAIVPSASTRSSRLMPTPLSVKVSVFLSGSTADRDGEGSPAFDQLGLGDRLVAQLLAGVGGVGDEFAHEDVAVGIDRMHHQVQQPRNVGFETLGFRAAASARAASSAFDWASVVKMGLVASWEITPGAASRAGAAHIAARLERFQSGSPGKARDQAKKSGSAGRGPADPPACVAIFDSTRHSGAGGQKHRAPSKPNHRGSGY